MPFSVGDVNKHYKGLTSAQKKTWVKVANTALSACMAKGKSDAVCAPSAIRIANSAVNKMKNKEGANILCESVPLNFNEATIDIKDRKIRNVVFIASGLSKNNRYYSESALSTLVPFLKESRLMFVNHRDIHEGRDIARDWISKIIPESVHQDLTGAIVGDVEMTGNPTANWLFEEIEKDPTILGLSIYAFALSERGTYEGKDCDVITKFVGCHSVDWVYNPGAKGGFDNSRFEFNVPVDSSEGALVLEALEVDRYIDVKEDFERLVNLRLLNSAGYWLTDYILYNVLYSPDLTKEDKFAMVEEASKFFSTLIMTIVKNPSFIDSFENADDDSDTSDKLTSPYEKESFELTKYEELKEYQHLIDKFVDSQKERHISHKEKEDMTLKEFATNHPELYSILLGEATLAASTNFEEARKLLVTTAKEASDKVSVLEKELDSAKQNLVKNQEDFEKIKKDFEEASAKLKKLEDAETAREAEGLAAKRKVQIEDLVKELNLKDTDIPTSLLEKMKNVETFTDEEISQTLKDLAGLRKVQLEKGTFGLEPLKGIKSEVVANDKLDEIEKQL